MKKFKLNVMLEGENRCFGCPSFNTINRPDAGCYDYCLSSKNKEIPRVRDEFTFGNIRPEWCPLEGERNMEEIRREEFLTNFSLWELYLKARCPAIMNVYAQSLYFNEVNGGVGVYFSWCENIPPEHQDLLLKAINAICGTTLRFVD